MFAVIGKWDVPGSREDAIEGLTSNVIPFIRTLPGFVSARFARAVDSGSYYSYLVFDDRPSAERFVTVSAPSRRPAQAEAGVERVAEFVVVEVLADVDADAAVPA
ncbi:antibiotic biosynthesis monooxygenase family protein [Agromyces laixinhei]|uniref:antibiotic biosynthesis monooxygenase family protein n=1 Tax=Agromyces laixinhei TaxID=2585717 RepID=UPI0012ED3A9D|nr:hypothetical protein [Agromyces laixinhei]